VQIWFKAFSDKAHLDDLLTSSDAPFHLVILFAFVPEAATVTFKLFRD